jgi:hypothetical protein
MYLKSSGLSGEAGISSATGVRGNTISGPAKVSYVGILYILKKGETFFNNSFLKFLFYNVFLRPPGQRKFSQLSKL